MDTYGIVLASSPRPVSKKAAHQSIDMNLTG